MRTVVITTSMLALSAALSGTTPAFSHSQPTEKGYDGDNYSKGDQRDNEDHETNYDWVGFFGSAGLVGVIGPKRS